MVWFCVWQIVSTLLELARLGRRAESDKDLEILLLRRQLAIYERRQARSPRLSRGEKLTLVVLATQLKTRTGRTIKAMGEVIRIVKPTTLFRWHRELVRRKWTYRQQRAGRPRTDKAIEQLMNEQESARVKVVDSPNGHKRPPFKAMLLSVVALVFLSCCICLLLLLNREIDIALRGGGIRQRFETSVEQVLFITEDPILYDLSIAPRIVEDREDFYCFRADRFIARGSHQPIDDVRETYETALENMGWAISEGHYVNGDRTLLIGLQELDTETNYNQAIKEFLSSTPESFAKTIYLLSAVYIEPTLVNCLEVVLSSKSP